MGSDEWPAGRLSERFNAIQGDLAEMAHVVAQLAEVSVEVRYLRESVNRLHEDLTKMADAIKKRDDVRVTESASNRRALYTLTGTLLAALIAASASMVVAGVFG